MQHNALFKIIFNIIVLHLISQKFHYRDQRSPSLVNKFYSNPSPPYKHPLAFKLCVCVCVCVCMCVCGVCVCVCVCLPLKTYLVVNLNKTWFALDMTETGALTYSLPSF